MMKTNNKKKGSTAKKLLPATMMLAVSASMLATSTYAWFTMSKEVEVTGIQMTATVPATVELSLGYGQSGNTLTGKTGTDGIELVKAPENSDTSLDWSNTVAFYDYYAAPKLIPASSINGSSIWSTTDADGVGKTVKADGTSTAATKGTLTLVSANTSTPNNSADAHYVDFPVWLRTSETSNITLSVKANVTDGENNAAVATAGSGSMLYKAARVSILTSADGSAAPASSAGVIIPAANGTAQTTGKYYVDGKALGSAATLGTQGSGAAYGDVDAVTQNTTANMTTGADGEAVITLKGKGGTLATNYVGNSTNTSSNYGDATCVIVRVWLEGEDEDCWNATAGQDFQIALEFTKKDT
jgi:hypothetical protein